MTESTQAFSVRLPLEIHEAARIKSIRTKTSLNEIIVEKITEWVNEPENVTPTTRHPSPTQRRKPVTA